MMEKIVDVFTAIVWGLTASMIGAFGVYSISTALNTTSMYVSPDFIRMGSIFGALLWGISAAIFYLYLRGTFYKEKAGDALKLAEENGEIARSTAENKD